MLIEIGSRRGRRLGLGLWPGGLCLGTAGSVYVEFLWRDNRASSHVPDNTKQRKENQSDREKYRQNPCSRIMRMVLDQTVTGETLLQRQTAGGRR